MTFNIKHKNKQKDAQFTVLPSSRPASKSTYESVDLNEFAHLFTDSSLSEDQQAEFLGAIWYIVTGFVDLGFGGDAVQLVINAIAAETPPVPAQLADKFTSANNKRKTTRTIGDEE